MANLQDLEIPFGRGLNETDSEDVLEEGQVPLLSNLTVLRNGGVSPRRAFQNQGAINVNGEVIAIIPFPHGTFPSTIPANDPPGGVKRGGVVLYYRDGSTYFASLSTSGLVRSIERPIDGWTGGAVRPRVTYALVGRLLFFTDEDKQHGLTRFDPAAGAGGEMVQPVFAFSTETPDIAKPRVIAEYNNHLFMAGHGSESDPDRPEAVRFSYLGLDASQDDGGAGDAGSGTSANLFDLEDAFLVGERGTPIVSMSAASGRLIIATASAAYTLFGYGRDSFQVELMDNQRGSISSRSMIAAAGSVWWWSPLGPVQWSGQLKDLSQPIIPRLQEVPQVPDQKIFAYHAVREREIRWYYAPGNVGDPERALCYNYERGLWTLHDLNVSVIAAGSISEHWTSAEGAVLLPGPASGPSSHEVTDRTSGSAISRWVNGDFATDTETFIQRSRLVGGVWEDWTPEVKVPQGATSYQHTGLASASTYKARVWHRRNGVLSAQAESPEFITLAAGSAPAPPTNLAAWHYGGDPTVIVPGPGQEPTHVQLSWGLQGSDLKTQIERSVSGSGVYEVVATTSFDHTSYLDPIDVSQTTTWRYRVKAINLNQQVSDPSNAVDITVQPVTFS
jgi:hypothetical protein